MLFWFVETNFECNHQLVFDQDFFRMQIVLCITCLFSAASVQFGECIDVLFSSYEQRKSPYRASKVQKLVAVHCKQSHVVFV